MTHIQSQRVRLRITLERVIENSPAPLETIRGLPSPWPLYLGTVSCWRLFLPAHFGWHWHTTHLAVFVPITELLFGAARLQTNAAGGTLKPFQTFGFSVGKLGCYHLHLIYSPLPAPQPRPAVFLLFLQFYWVKKYCFDLKKIFVPMSHTDVYP